ncbi:hypothetical protein [Glaciimonas sp. PCH181]|uniref:hypothetical protein n=1 Tax=Glaciimonas sp. PCH181 TaxID=2133943 RepID=UPI000D3A22F8|nr:hypothetical protein [Glaciimonas sp. PCH181]PUA18918.1 hypothetical protein C7W93_03125 [Glaciimonas sp. PCH181]
MNAASINSIVNAVLYEGYMLYPYRASSVKNRQRWTFGGVYPHAYNIANGGAESWMIQTQCLLQGGPDTVLIVTPGFLHLIEREAGELTPPLAAEPNQTSPDLPSYRAVEILTIDGKRFYAWQEAIEQQIAVDPLAIRDVNASGLTQRITSFTLAGQREWEPLRNAHGEMAGVLVRTRRCINGEVEIHAELIAENLYQITVILRNNTPLPNACNISRDAATLQALVSCHLILSVTDGQFVSSIDPPAAFARKVAECKNHGVWPVLVGDEGSFDTMLASPIILYDYPQVAPESPGDLFDGTEIDEILTLRILTMTDQEKAEMAAVDERSRALLERTEKLTPQQLQQLHGTLRGPGAFPAMEESSQTIGAPWEEIDNKPRLAFLRVNGRDLRVGDQVRLRPRGNADIFDLALAGKIATIESLERDFEDRIHIAITLDDDPGRDLGLARMPGHRFFFGPEEVEPIASEGANT